MVASEYWVRVAATRLVVKAAQARDLTSEAICAAAGIPLLPEDPNARIPLDRHFAVWAAAMRAVRDPGFPLEVAQLGAISDFDTVGYAARAAPTLDTAIRVMVRFGRLHASDNGFELEREDGGVRLFMPPSGPLPLAARCATEMVLAQATHLVRELVGAELRPLEVTFRHPPPASVAAHARFFGTSPRFDQARTSLLLDPDDLERPVQSADPGLHAVLVRHAEAALAELHESTSFSGQVQRSLHRLLPAGVPTVAEAARNLACSERTLRRRLEAEGTTFQRLTDEVRRALTERYLEQDRLSVDEVALLVGFSDARSLRRAFRRWTGRAPTEARRMSS